MTTTARLMTAEELLDMPDDGFRYEIVRGELRKMGPAGHVHGKLAMSIGARLWTHVKANGLGEVYGAETGFVLGSDPRITFGLLTRRSFGGRGWTQRGMCGASSPARQILPWR